MESPWRKKLTPTTRTITWLNTGYLVGLAVLFFGYTTGGSPWSPLLLAGFLLYQFERSRRRMHRAANFRHNLTSAAHRTAPVQEGTIALLGRVRYLDGATRAVEAEIVQDGTETERSGGWNFAWRERNRKINVQPFCVELADSTVVFVEPPATGLRFADEIAHQLIAGTEQTSIARLDFNEEILLVGNAQKIATRPNANRAYREVAFDWHLRGAPMWIVSTSTVAHFEARARMHRLHAYCYLALLIPLVVVLFRLTDRALGYTETGLVTSSGIARDRDAPQTTVQKHGEKIETCAKGPTTAYCEKSYFSYPTDGYQLYMRVGRFSVNYGVDARLVEWEEYLILFDVIATLLAAVGLRRSAYRALPWYRSEPYQLEGEGRLPVGE